MLSTGLQSARLIAQHHKCFTACGRLAGGLSYMACSNDTHHACTRLCNVRKYRACHGMQANLADVHSMPLQPNLLHWTHMSINNGKAFIQCWLNIHYTRWFLPSGSTNIAWLPLSSSTSKLPPLLLSHLALAIFAPPVPPSLC